MRSRMRSAASSAPNDVGVRQEDDELLAAEAAAQVGLAQGFADGAGDFAQHEVAGQRGHVRR